MRSEGWCVLRTTTLKSKRCRNFIEANLNRTRFARYRSAALCRVTNQGGLAPNQHGAWCSMRALVGRRRSGLRPGDGREAMQLGIERALQHGSCIVAPAIRIIWAGRRVGRASNRAGLVSLHFVNVITRSIVAPYGGADARFGTNPFAAGIPLMGHEPVILDFATSMLAQGKTRVAFNKGELLPTECVLDDHGRPTREPRYAVNPPFGAILAFGEHKGYGLALLCELLGGALAAGMTHHSEDITERRILNGMLTVLIDPPRLPNAQQSSANAC